MLNRLGAYSDPDERHPLPPYITIHLTEEETRALTISASTTVAGKTAGSPLHTALAKLTHSLRNSEPSDA